MDSPASLLFVLAVCVPLANGQEPDAKPKPSPVVAKIISIGQEDNKVQEHLDYLTNRIGPRLTGSEGLQAAGEWADGKFKAMGLTSRMEQWGEIPVGFERGPSYGRMVAPKKMRLEFGTNAWTAGTKGRVVAEVLMAPKSMEELEKMRDKIEGNYVLLERPPRRRRTRQRRTPPPAETPKAADEKSDDDKKDDKPEPAKKPAPMTREQMVALMNGINDCQPAGLISSTNDELITTRGSFRVDMDKLPTVPRINLQKKQFDEIKSQVIAGEEVELEFDIRNHFRKGPIPVYNVIADIPGTEFPDEYVVVGGHLDSWDGATGATDNAAGCATTIEAARLLMAAGVKPRRTIRFMLWSGEEQGLLGSRAYVEKHKDDVSKNCSAVFVHDGGTNYVAGVRCTKAMKADFETVFSGVKTLSERMPFDIAVVDTMRPRGGSDHVSFIRAGVPGFFWMQKGRATYRTTHHTQYDTYESIVPEYQAHSSIMIAIGALGTANLDKLLPREGVVSQ